MYKLKKNNSKKKHDQPDYIVKDDALNEIGEGRKRISKDGKKEIVITIDRKKEIKKEPPADNKKLPYEPTFKIR